MKPARRTRIFATPEEAENAFYDAFERADLAAMMAVWSQGEGVVCVHPRGPRLVGFDAVRDSWAQIFAGGATVRIRSTDVKRFDGQGVAVHTLVEVLTAASGQSETSRVCATNVYELTDGGWRLVVHHATPMPEAAPAEEAAPPAGHTLH